MPGEFIAEPRHWPCTGPWRASRSPSDRGEGVSQEEEESEQSSAAEKVSTHQGQLGPGSPQIWGLGFSGPGKPREMFVSLSAERSCWRACSRLLYKDADPLIYLLCTGT